MSVIDGKLGNGLVARIRRFPGRRCCDIECHSQDPSFHSDPIRPHVIAVRSPPILHLPPPPFPHQVAPDFLSRRFIEIPLNLPKPQSKGGERIILKSRRPDNVS